MTAGDTQRTVDGQTEADGNVLCGRRARLDGGTDWNSIVSARTPNNSKVAAPGHILPVKVVCLTRRTPYQSHSVISVYLTASLKYLYPNNLQPQFEGFPHSK